MEITKEQIEALANKWGAKFEVGEEEKKPQWYGVNGEREVVLDMDIDYGKEE